MIEVPDLTPEQNDRVCAFLSAQIAIQSSAADVELVDVIDLAEWIRTGTHPSAAYRTTASAERPGDASMRRPDPQPDPGVLDLDVRPDSTNTFYVRTHTTQMGVNGYQQDVADARWAVESLTTRFANMMVREVAEQIVAWTGLRLTGEA